MTPEDVEAAFADSPLFAELAALMEQPEAKPFQSGAKRQHFVPQLLLRRFSCGEGKKRILFQLDTKTGQPERTDTRAAASRLHLYSVPGDDGERDNSFEGFLMRVETHAAPALETLVSAPQTLSPGERATLSFFFALQTQRTPAAAAEIEQVANTVAQTLVGTESFGDPVAFAEKYVEWFGDGKSPEEIETFRLKLIREVREGRFQLVDPGGAAFATGFAVAPEQAARIFTLSWTVLRGEGGLVTSDRGFAMHDPAPIYPWASQGLYSSPEAQTAIPLADDVCLLLRPLGRPLIQTEASAEHVETVNLWTYGWADRYIYGRSQEVVTNVRRAAKRYPQHIVEPRPHYQVIAFDADPEDDTFAEANLQRGWPPQLVYDGHVHDYVAFPYGSLVPELHEQVDATVEERARKSLGFPKGVRPPGTIRTDTLDPSRTEPGR